MGKLEIFLWCNTVLAIIGTFLNAKRVRFGFIIWMVTNTVFVVNNLIIKSFPQAALFGVYLVLAVFGWISWGKEAKEAKAKDPQNVA